MRISFSDEKGLLNEEVLKLMEQAADLSLKNEVGDFDAEVSLTIVDEDEIQNLNREYRGNDSVTDVLSFPMFETIEDLKAELSDDEREEILIGDVVICYEQAMRQAEEYETGSKRELLYLFVHSMMHLLGYDHMNEEDKALMREHEEAVLNAMGINR